MLTLFWERIGLLIDVSALLVTFLAYRHQARSRSANAQRTRVGVRERVREVRFGNWFVWRSADRDEDIDRS